MLYVSIIFFAVIALSISSSSKVVHVTPTSTVTKRSNSRKTQLANFFAGGLAGTISSTLTMPLEIVKTQLQSSRIGKSGPKLVVQQIMQKEGPRGFFKGIQPMIIGIVPTRAIYFWAYSTTKTSLTAKIGDTPANHLLSAFAAGIASNTIMNPLWMVKTRFQIMADASVGQKVFKNYQEVARAIWKEEGPGGFFKGITASYVGCFEGAIQWMVYEKLKAALSVVRPLPSVAASPAIPMAEVPNSLNSKYSFSFKNFGRKPVDDFPPPVPVILEVPTTRTPTSVELFLAAGLSKFVAVLMTYPHEVVRTRLREQSTMGVFKYKGFAGALSTIAKEEGRRGLYGGMGMHLLRSVPNAAVMFLSYELASSWLDRDKEGPLLDKLEVPNLTLFNGTESSLQLPVVARV